MRINPKIENMTKEERKAWEAWELKLRKMEFDSQQKDAYNKIHGGRGWIF